MDLDHVIIAVSDLDEAAAEVRERYGVISVVGGRHVGWGTANRIVPLGDTYLELVTVVDENEAAASAFGRWVASAGADSLLPLGWVVRTADIEAVARRLRLEVTSGSRPTGDGAVLRWQLAGVAEAAADPALPFFVQWGEGMTLPGRAEVDHPAGTVRLEGVELRGDVVRVSVWLDGHGLPIDVIQGAEPGVTGVLLASDAGECWLRPGAAS